MTEPLRQMFSYVCGQVHVWAPAGDALPMCQRCTGLYVGGVYAAAVIGFFLPKPDKRMLWVHGIAMLLMIPFGYHLLPQSAIVRTVSGQVFAAGLVYYLLLNPGDRWQFWRERNGRWKAAYFGCLLAGIPLLLADLNIASVLETRILAWIGAIGLLMYVVLLFINLYLFALFGFGRSRGLKAA